MLDFNNTFLGRFTVGPLVMFVGFVGARPATDARGRPQGPARLGATISPASLLVLAWTGARVRHPALALRGGAPISACRS